MISKEPGSSEAYGLQPTKVSLNEQKVMRGYPTPEEVVFWGLVVYGSLKFLDCQEIGNSNLTHQSSFFPRVGMTLSDPENSWHKDSISVLQSWC